MTLSKARWRSLVIDFIAETYPGDFFDWQWTESSSRGYRDSLNLPARYGVVLATRPDMSRAQFVAESRMNGTGLTITNMNTGVKITRTIVANPIPPTRPSLWTRGSYTLLQDGELLGFFRQFRSAYTWMEYCHRENPHSTFLIEHKGEKVAMAQGTPR